MQQILVDTPATLSQSWYVDGTIVDPGVVTVTITKSDGTALYTDASTTGSGAAARTRALTTSDTANVDTLTVVWTSPTYGDLVDTVQIVGALIFTEVEARSFAAKADESSNAPLNDATEYPDAKILDVRTEIAQEFRTILGYPVGLHYERSVLDGTGTDELLVRDEHGDSVIHLSSIRSVEYRDSGETTWTAYTAAQLADILVDSWGRITRESLGTFTKGRRNIRVGFEYGISPSHRHWYRIKRAALILALDKLVPSNVGDRAITVTNEFGVTERRSLPGARRDVWYGIPDVDAALAIASERVPGIG